MYQPNAGALVNDNGGAHGTRESRRARARGPRIRAEADERALAWWPLVIASGTALVCAALTYLLFVRTSIGRRFDSAAYLGSLKASRPVAAAADNQLRLITTGSFAIFVVVLFLIAVFRRRYRLGCAVAGGAVLAVVGSDAMKVMVPQFGSFPSGHTATAMACGLGLMVVVPPRWRGAVAVAVGAGTAIVAADVQVALWHRPVDAIGGAFLAFAAITAATAMVARYRPASRFVPRRSPIPLGLLGGGGLLAAVVLIWGGIRTFGWLTNASRPADTSASISHAAYVAGLAGTSFLVLLLVSAFLVLLGSADLDADPTRVR